MRASIEKAESGIVGADTLYSTFAKHVKAKKLTVTEEDWHNILNNEYNGILRQTQEFVAAKHLFPKKGMIYFFVNGALTPLTYENQYFVRSSSFLS